MGIPRCSGIRNQVSNVQVETICILFYNQSLKLGGFNMGSKLPARITARYSDYFARRPLNNRIKASRAFHFTHTPHTPCPTIISAQGTTYPSPPARVVCVNKRVYRAASPPTCELRSPACACPFALLITERLHSPPALKCCIHPTLGIIAAIAQHG